MARRCHEHGLMTERKPVLLLDVDGVIVDFVGAYLRAVNRRTDGAWVPDDVTEWDIRRGIQVGSGIHEFAWNALCEDHDLLQPYPGAIESVRGLMSVAEVYFVTTSAYKCRTWARDRETWLENHFNDDSLHRRVVHTSAKHLVRGDVFVDDKPENVTAWIAANPSGTALLWDRPWNRTATLPAFAGLRRVSLWDDVVAAVQSVIRRG